MVDAATAALSINPAAVECPQDDPSNRFKVAVYRYVRNLFERGHQKDIYALIDTDSRKTILFEQNPYNWALSALLKEGSFGILTPNSVNNMGWQLMHAHRHHIPPDLLIGFLYQTAASGTIKQKKIKKKGSEYRESWFPQVEAIMRNGLPPRIKPK